MLKMEVIDWWVFTVDCYFSEGAHGGVEKSRMIGFRVLMVSLSRVEIQIFETLPNSLECYEPEKHN